MNQSNVNKTSHGRGHRSMPGSQARLAEFNAFKRHNAKDMAQVAKHIVSLHNNAVDVNRELRKIKRRQMVGFVAGVATIVGLTLVHHHGDK
jgi:hypothetical protein